MSVTDDVKWECPKCGADPNGHGAKGPARECCEGRSCMGFVCECETPESFNDEKHGYNIAKACPSANCYCCGWGGKFPKLPAKMPPWAKKALAEGWTAPEGWTP